MSGENGFEQGQWQPTFECSAPLINNFPKPRLMMIETTVNNFMIRMPESNKCLLDSRWLSFAPQLSKGVSELKINVQLLEFSDAFICFVF